MYDLNKLLEQHLTEGVTFGQKQINDILSRSGDFNIGVEYEIRPNAAKREALLDGDYEKAGLVDYNLDRDIREVVTEHDSMVEIITKKMSLKDGMNHIKNMFVYLTNNNIEVPEMAGMHISVSTNKYSLDKMNFLKFYLLMDTDFIHKIFPPRDHVHNSINNIKNSIYMWARQNDEEYSKTKMTTRKLKEIEKSLLEVFQRKYQTINIGDYIMHDGRIELRFFGGQDYHTMYDDIKLQLLRSLFLMELAYTDLYQKEYYSELGKVMLDAIKMDDNDKTTLKDSTMKLLQAIKSNDGEKILSRLESGHLMFPISKIPPKIKAKIKEVMLDNPMWAVRFSTLIQERFEDAEPEIKKDAKLAVHYAINVLHRRFEEAEDVIFSDDSASLSLYVRKAFKNERLPTALEKKFANISSNGYAWFGYVQRLYDEKIVTNAKDAQDKLPLLNNEALIDLISRYSIEKSKLAQIIELGILNERNIQSFLKAIAYNAGDNISSGAVSLLLRKYVELFGVISVDDEIRNKLIEKSYQYQSYFDEFNVDDKIAYVTSFYKDLKDFMDRSGFDPWQGITRSIIDGATLMKPLFPLTPEFKEKYYAKTGHELPKDLVDYEE